MVEGEERIIQRELRGKEGIIQPNVCRQSMKDRSADCSSQELTEVPQNLFPDIEILILTSNWLGGFGPSSFRRYLHLRALYLDKNRIDFIMTETFYALQQLEKLVLSASTQAIFSPKIFQYSHNLKYLDQSYNYLTSQTFEIVSFLPKLENLRLMFCPLTDITIPPCHEKREKLRIDTIDVSDNDIDVLSPENVYFECPVDTLILDGNALSRIEPVTIATLPIRSLSLGNKPRSPEVLKSVFLGISRSSIEELYIKNAGITSIPDDMLYPLRNKSLTLLDLSGNDLILLPFIFKALSFVSTLQIVDSSFEEIIPEYFDGMNALRNLTLGTGSFTKLNPHHSEWKLNLTVLDIQISWHKRGQSWYCNYDNLFNGLQHLKYLKFIDRDLTSPVCDVHRIDISFPNVEFVEFGISRGNYRLNLYIPHAKEFSCFGNGDSAGVSFQFYLDWYSQFTLPEKINVSHAGVMETKLFDYVLQTSVLYLDMSKNHIKGIPSGDFDHFSSLETLDLKGNKITLIASDAFVGLLSLKTLYLEHNQIVYLSENIFQKMMSLESLHLDYNQLDYLDNDLFANTSFLRTLTMSSNKFDDFNRSTFDMIRSSVEEIDLSSNPLICNCDNIWLVQDFEILLINYNATYCSKVAPTLDNLRGKTLSMFQPRKCCSNMIALSILLMSFVITITILLAIIAYNNSYRLKYQFFLFKLTILGYTEITDAHDMDDYEYDVNIMFSDQTKEWATGHFKPMLQERLPNFNRIAFDDGDLILGMHYFDAVYTNVEKSFKNIFLLNKRSVRDHIFMTKFRIAMNLVTDTETENMVLVFLENIPEDELPYLIRLYLTGQGEHILWEEDEEGQDYFWYKFERFMRANLKINHMVPPE